MAPRNKNWTKEEDGIVSNNYHKLTRLEISKLIDRTVFAIQTRARKLNISSIEKARKLHKERIGTYCNENYFEKLTIENCYWAGFLAADGSISDDGHLALQISDKDYEHCKKFAETIEFTGKLSQYIRKNGIGMCAFSIKSEKLCQDLKKHFNIIPRKTLVLQPPNLQEKEHIYAYIIGYIDGDGWISLRKNYNHPKLGFIGQENIIKWILEHLSNLLTGIEKEKFMTKKIQKYINHCSVSMSNITSVKYIIQYLQKYNVPKLDRKWGKII